MTCIWLMPFYPSPDRDDGYDYYAVDPTLGSLGDLVAFVRTARDRGLRVIVDLVLNRTSDQHPWFRDSRRSKDDPTRDWYVWAEEPPEVPHAEVVFPDAEAASGARTTRRGSPRRRRLQHRPRARRLRPPLVPPPGQRGLHRAVAPAAGTVST